MTMLTVSIAVAALVSLAAAKFAADAARAKTAVAVAKSKRRLQRVLPALAAFALVAFGAAYPYTSA
jgi:hypothetical protein